MPLQNPNIKLYEESISDVWETGLATEHSYRAALAALLKSVLRSARVINEPNRVACGAPDLQVLDGKVPLGHVEAKDITVKLSSIVSGKGENGKQFVRYLDALPNWILTNHLEFQWYVKGQLQAELVIGRIKGKSSTIEFDPEAVDGLRSLLHAFFSSDAFKVTDAATLSKTLAGMTRNLRSLIIETYDFEKPSPDKPLPFLHKWLKAFKDLLMAGIEVKSFADMLAQTVAYGLFAARLSSTSEETFSLGEAARSVPRTNPFLRKLFGAFSGPEMPESLEWAINDMVRLMTATDTESILSKFGKGDGKNDPVFHFYETFLSEYDPALRQQSGVYYTPRPAVEFVVKSIDYILRDQFSKPEGLADDHVMVLDPAVGTATFLHSVIDLISSRFKGQEGLWDSYVSECLLKRIFGFELMMAPYAIAHLKLGRQLNDLGYRFQSSERLGVYLTNTLEETAHKTEELFSEWLAEETNEAMTVKTEKPIMVVVGNPPYSSSQYKGKWITDLMEEYKKGLNEKKSNILREEWKFLRFAQWRIEQTGCGIIGYVINNSFLDGSSFRIMRKSLLDTFSDIYILNLHGSVKGMDGATTEDRNIFDITQGVAIVILVRHNDHSGHAKVHYHDSYGSRTEKLDFLDKQSVETVDWTRVSAAKEEYLFVPRTNNKSSRKYDGWLSLDDIFRNKSSGIQTKNDKFLVAFTREEMLSKVRSLDGLTLAEAKRQFPSSDDGAWQYDDALKDLKSTKQFDKRVVPLLYKPMDTRWIYFTDSSSGWLGRPRYEISRHMLDGDNIALIGMRQAVADNYNHFLASKHLVVHGTFYLGNKGQDYLFPLYLKPDGEHVAEMFAEPEVNFTERMFVEWGKALGRSLSRNKIAASGQVPAMDVFSYIYGVAYSPLFRDLFEEELKRSFPRIPTPPTYPIFKKMAEVGRGLVDCHVSDIATEGTFPVKGDNTVSLKKDFFHEAEGSVYINEKQYFGGVSSAAWNHEIGGYKVLEKWLEGRFGRKLGLSDIRNFQSATARLNRTIELEHQADVITKQILESA